MISPGQGAASRRSPPRATTLPRSAVRATKVPAAAASACPPGERNVPEAGATIKVVVNGQMPAHVGPKDLILHLVGLLLALDALVDLLAVHGDVLRSIDADAHLVPFDPQNRDGHVVTNHDGLADTSCKNEHLPYPLPF